MPFNEARFESRDFVSLLKSVSSYSNEGDEADLDAQAMVLQNTNCSIQPYNVFNVFSTFSFSSKSSWTLKS